MDTISKVFTICFFENPAALQEIKLWEQLKFNEIMKKTVFLSGMRIYELSGKKNFEILFCFPIEYLNSVIPLKSYIETYSNHPGEYLKTILFGKFTAKELKDILSNTLYFELKRKGEDEHKH